MSKIESNFEDEEDSLKASMIKINTNSKEHSPFVSKQAKNQINIDQSIQTNHKKENIDVVIKDSSNNVQEQQRIDNMKIFTTSFAEEEANIR